MFHVRSSNKTLIHCLAESRCAKAIESQATKVEKKKMLIAFFDSKGPVLTGQTENSTFYLEVMKRLMRRIRRIRHEYRDLGS